MKKRKITLVILILLTIISALISEFEIKYAVITLLGLAVIKFIGVSFFFMDLRKAHSFWKAAILLFLLIFTTTILVVI